MLRELEVPGGLPPVPVNNFTAHLTADMFIAGAQNAMPNTIATQVKGVRDATN
jgi:hypothetical protein